MIKISETTLTDLTQEAFASKRLRKNRNYHPTYEDPVNRMLNAFEPNTYVCPHRHKDPDKEEVFIILRGKLLIIEYDDEGKVLDTCILDPGSGNYAVEIPAGVWHSAISLESGTVVYEIKNGPYEPLSDKNFAAWAPAEGDSSAKEYIQSLLKNFNI